MLFCDRRWAKIFIKLMEKKNSIHYVLGVLSVSLRVIFFVKMAKCGGIPWPLYVFIHIYKCISAQAVENRTWLSTCDIYESTAVK